MKCNKCLYKKNCQFLLKHKNAVVSGCTAFKDEADFVIKNSPFEMLDMAFKRLFPNVKYTAYFEPDIRDEADGTKVCGLTDFDEDGEIFIFIDTELTINNAVEIFAHELAHAGVGVEHEHDEAWEKAFDDLFNEYNKIGEELFSSNVNAPKGKDYVDALKEVGKEGINK